MGMREMLGMKDSRVQRFQKASQDKDKEEVRELERTLLKPDALPPYTGKRPPRSGIKQRTVKMIFDTDESMELLKRFCKVNTFKEQNSHDVGVIVALLEALDRGSLRYDTEHKTLNFVDEQGEQWAL